MNIFVRSVRGYWRLLEAIRPTQNKIKFIKRVVLQNRKTDVPNYRMLLDTT
jgi:hypothetical protein